MGQTRQHRSKKGGKTDKVDHMDCKHRRKQDTGENNKDNQKKGGKTRQHRNTKADLTQEDKTTKIKQETKSNPKP